MAYLPRIIRQSTFGLFKTKNPLRRIATSSLFQNNYEGDGKTVVTILNKEYKHLIMIDTISEQGFRLNNGIFVMGPMVTFPRTVLQWSAVKVQDVTPESLSLFALLEPKLDILVLGTGEKSILPSKDALEFLKSKKISVEIMSTEKACSTFNFLNVEGRCVAGAFLPPENVKIYEVELEKFTYKLSDQPTGYIL